MLTVSNDPFAKRSSLVNTLNYLKQQVSHMHLMQMNLKCTSSQKNRVWYFKLVTRCWVFKGIVHPKSNILSSFTSLLVFFNMYVLLLISLILLQLTCFWSVALVFCSMQCCSWLELDLFSLLPCSLKIYKAQQVHWPQIRVANSMREID